MIVVCAATLFIHNIEINSAADAALAIAPFAGAFASHLFAIGLIIASIMGAAIVPLTTAYVYAEFFGVEGGLDKSFTESKQFHLVFFSQLILASLFLLLPNFSLFRIVLYTQALNGALLPVLIYYLIRFCNDTERMGNHVNGKYYNYLSASFAVVILFASVFVIIGGLLGKI